MDDIAIVAIGRNEGDRLRRGLASVSNAGIRLVYVDSGSTDDSIEIAKAAGAQIVELDMSVPFSAARARNAGAERALVLSPKPRYIQFIDGDCAVANGWLETAREYLEGHQDVVLVTGWRAEQDRDASVYNAMCDEEWHQPAGDIEECGGDLMVRAEAHEKIGGYNPVVIAGEDIDYCLRLGTLGRRVLLPQTMTLHDAAMLSFGQWWRRAVRAGHSYAHINDLHPGRSRRELLRAAAYGAVMPIAAILCLIFLPAGLVLICAAYALSYVKTVAGLRRNGQSLKESLHHSLFLWLSKFPNFIGLTTFYKRKLRCAEMKIIEYK